MLSLGCYVLYVCVCMFCVLYMYVCKYVLSVSGCVLNILCFIFCFGCLMNKVCVCMNDLVSEIGGVECVFLCFYMYVCRNKVLNILCFIYLVVK